MPTQAEKKAEEQRQKVLAEGSFATLESDDNSIDVSNNAYIGVDPEYRNGAEYDGVALQAPESTKSKDNPEAAAVEEKAKASAESLTNLQVNRLGHTPNEHKAGQGVKVADQQAAAEAEADDDDDGSGDGGTSEEGNAGGGTPPAPAPF